MPVKYVILCFDSNFDSNDNAKYHINLCNSSNGWVCKGSGKYGFITSNHFSLKYHHAVCFDYWSNRNRFISFKSISCPLERHTGEWAIIQLFT